MDLFVENCFSINGVVVKDVIVVFIEYGVGIKNVGMIVNKV